MNTEYVRNLHSNYVRVALGEKPEEQRYQYCILSRGGIKGLLPCSLRYLDGEAYLYYDITSRQNLVQFYQKGNITREWVLDFVESLRILQRELGRFLLQTDHVIWEPQHIFQDLESNVFSYLYVPYYDGENQFLKLLGFLVEKIDYGDETLVECIYKMYEQVEKNGAVYLQEQIFQDVKILERKEKRADKAEVFTSPRTIGAAPERRELPEAEKKKNERQSAEAEKRKNERQSAETEDGINEWQSAEPAEVLKLNRAPFGKTDQDILRDGNEWEKGGRDAEESICDDKETGTSKKLFGIFENRKGKKQREAEKREEYRESMQRALEGYAVAEEQEYEEEYGRTTFLTERPEKKDTIHRLYYADGRKASELDTPNLLIGKYKGKVDLFLEDESVSRMHARILKDQDQYYLEDENSTNGTYCKRIRLQPYERRKLEAGDEIRIGNVLLFFR